MTHGSGGVTFESQAGGVTFGPRAEDVRLALWPRMQAHRKEDLRIITATVNGIDADVSNLFCLRVSPGIRAADRL